ncbi:ankyrin repeat domain-containing protein [uncultured Aquimarina sp.]|uniref:ankyrin repeat domain-containing protein n=1 Tax=uncultured Aquimarina sp. TaxID=575652 RepID=UPI002618173F|nr:ankyrin repeat domain-containing protein [uncultured Aquimarina sp.]
MNLLEKYLVLKKNNNTQFCLITTKKTTCIIINGESVQTATIEIKHFDDIETSQKEADNLILATLEQGYEEDKQPDEFSVFSIALEQLKTEDVKEFENRLLILKTLVDVYYSGDKHPFVQFLGVPMKDEELGATPILDEYIQKHINKLSSSSLVYVFQMTLQNIYFNFKATAFVVEEIIKRKDLEAQLAIVDQFYEACEYYDSGHRSWSSTNQDELIDTYFPEFESEALLKLLEQASGDMLNSDGGDCMDDLFVAAINNSNDNNLQQKLLDVLEAYKIEYEEEGYVEEDYFDSILEAILESAPTNVIQGVENIKENKQKREALLKAIEELNSLKIKKLLNQGAKFDDRLIEKALEDTLEKKDLSIIKLFKSKGIKFNIEALFQNPKEHTDLLLESIESDIIDVNYTNKESNKNLLFFVSENKILLEALLKKGVDVNHRDSAGETILRRVCSYAKGENQKYIDLVKLLLEHKANPNLGATIEGRENGIGPLHHSIKNEAIEITKLLINALADVNGMPENGKNPLMLAHQTGNDELINVLTEAQATAPEKELLKIKFMRCASQQEWDQLLEMEEEIVSEYSDEFTINLNLAQAYYLSRRDYTKAANYAERTLLLEVNNKSLNILFMSLIRLGKAQQTIDIFLEHKANFNPERALSDNIIANLIVAYCASNQLKEGIEVLCPYFGKIDESRHEKGVMNFNIACMYALANDIHEMLPFVINALERKYTKDDFLNESDFAAYHTDELFLFIVDQDHKSTIELEEYTENAETNTFKKLSVKAFYNTGTFSFEDDEHEFTYETGTIGEEGIIQERLYSSKAQALTMYFKKLKKMHLEDKSMYFILKEDTSLDSEIKVNAPKDISSELDFLSGTKITVPVDTPMVFTTNAKTGDTILDFNKGKIPVMSGRFIELLKGAGVESMQTYPVIIKSKKDETEWEGYFAVNLLDIIACGAFPKSIFRENGPKYWNRCELAIDAEKADGALLFRLQEHLPTILFHRSVGKYIVDNDPNDEITWEGDNIIQ